MNTLPAPANPGARSLALFTRLDRLREDAGREVERAFRGVSQKRVDSVAIPGCSRSVISRASNADASNPLYRLGLMFTVARRLGVPKARLQRLIDWLQARLDEAYADAPREPIAEVLDADAEVDQADDLLRLRAARGCAESVRQLLDAKLRVGAQTRITIIALRREIAAVEGT